MYLPTILDNDEGPDYYLSDEFEQVASSEMFNTKITVYTDQYRWVFYVVDSARMRVFSDKSVTFAIRLVKEFFNDGKPASLRECVRQLAEKYPQLVDKLYRVV